MFAPRRFGPKGKKSSKAALLSPSLLFASSLPSQIPPPAPPRAHTREEGGESPPPLFLSIGLQRGESLYRKARLEEERGQICFIAPPEEEEEEEGLDGG